MYKPRRLLLKDTFTFIFVVLIVLLLILPFATTFNELLTRIAEISGVFRSIQNWFVPYLSLVTYGVLQYLPGLKVGITPFGLVVNGVDVRMTWNCIGWQSFLLVVISLFFGLRGNFTIKSKIQTAIFGLLGMFVINVFRLVFTSALVGWWNGLFVLLFHNYFSTFVAIGWLFFFWWFGYRFILEEQDGGSKF